MSTNWNELIESHEIAYLRGDLATSSPQSYTLEEKKAISEAMDASTREVEAAMRADFEQLPPEARSKLFAMLCDSGTESAEWWWNLLLGGGDLLYKPSV